MRVTQQRTLARTVRCAGQGLHSGRPSTIAIKPAGANAGFAFRRVDLPAEDNLILVNSDAVQDTRLATTLGNAAGAQVQTSEHVLAALVGMGVDNAVIEIDGPEPPAMDGSSAPFARLIAEAGLRNLGAPRRALRVLKPVEVFHEGKRARLEPCGRYEIDVTIDYPASVIGRQRVRFAPNPKFFLEDVAPARTFGFHDEVEALRKRGLALGGSLENAVVIRDDAVMNAEGLRFADEFARHKALDALGDLAVAGAWMIGRLVTERGGHDMNHRVLRALLARRDAWRIETMTSFETPANDVLADAPPDIAAAAAQA